MENISLKPEEKFRSPEEEIKFLRSRLEELAQSPKSTENSLETEKIASESIKEYAKHSPEEIYHEEHIKEFDEGETVNLDLSPEEHDDTISEFLHIIQKKGVHAALSEVAKMDNSHIEDDFHRFLVEYLKEGYLAKDLKEKDPLFKTLKMTLYEILLPDFSKEEGQRPLKEMISSMEQFYSGMLSVSENKKYNDYFTLEFAMEHAGEEVSFYASIPDEKSDLFEKQILSVFPKARIKVHKNDYNIFNPVGYSTISQASLEKSPAYPLKTYEQFDHDPLNALLNAFSKIKKEGEGAAIQLVFKPSGSKYIDRYKKAIDDIRDGVSPKKALEVPETVVGEFKAAIMGVFSKDDKKEENGPIKVDNHAADLISKKIESSIPLSNLRLIASADTQERADVIIKEMESAFNQFENPASNNLVFKKVSGNKTSRALREYSFRMFSQKNAIPLSIKELSTIIHLPGAGLHESSHLKKSKAGIAPAPVGIPSDGVLLGVNEFRNASKEIHFSTEDRLRHFYVIGQTGTGKTTLLKNMIVQDIKNGEGVCMIDPHGSDIQDVLAHIPKERLDDVIYFDPSHLDRPMGINMLEYDPLFPEQKTFVVNELLGIFNKLFDMKVAGGPMFEQYFRQATMLVLEDPSSGSTLLDISRVLADENFRRLKLSRSKNPIVNQFWTEIAQKAGGEASLQNIVPYITSKFDGFLGNDYMRPIITQEKSSFNFREIMDKRKILLVNLSKGRLGDINSHLLGLILVGKILMAALSRVDSFGKDMSPFYLYIDEFQNITTDSISTILSEARKYKLSLNIAHQFISQLEDGIRDSVFGNVGSMAVYRVGSEDASFLEKQFEPTFNAQDIMSLDNFNFYAKLLAHGEPKKPFSVKALRLEGGNPSQVEMIKKLSFSKYGKPREEVESEINKRYNTAI